MTRFLPSPLWDPPETFPIRRICKPVGLPESILEWLSTKSFRMVALTSKDQFWIDVLAYHMHIYRFSRNISDLLIDGQLLLLFIKDEKGGNLQCPVFRHCFYHERSLIQFYFFASQVG